MKQIIKTEEFAQLALAIAALAMQPIQISWWLWPVVFLSPDISMIGYSLNTRAGAIAYNAFHHKGIAIAVAASGYFLHLPVVLFIGILLFAHSAFDRLLGFGLKYSDGFKHTHLENI